MCCFKNLSFNHKTAVMLNLSHFHVNGTRQTKQCSLVGIIYKNETHVAHIRKHSNQTDSRILQKVHSKIINLQNIYIRYCIEMATEIWAYRMILVFNILCQV